MTHGYDAHGNFLPAQKLVAEIERLRSERDQLLEQLAIRSPSGVERDMQVIMARNNELLTLNAELVAAVDAIERWADDLRVPKSKLAEIARAALAKVKGGK